MKCYRMLFAVFACIVILPLSTTSAATQHFISITDIHFNPFYSCSKSPCKLIQKLNVENASQWKKILQHDAKKSCAIYGKDTNYALLKSALREIHTVSQKINPKFAILIGDYLAHNYESNYIKYSGDRSQENYRSFVKKTIEFLTNAIHAALPSIPIYSAVGNNDSYNGDYFSDPNGLFYRNTAATWSVFFMNKTNKANFMKEFPIAGYYHVKLLGDQARIRIIVLNTVLLSVKAQGKNLALFATAEINWLKQQLADAQAKQEKIWLVFHIPVGINIYKSITSKATASLLKPMYTREILNLISKYTTHITGIFTGHLHMDTFALFKNTQGRETFDSFTPAISPIFGNNPAFKVFAYDDNTYQINDFFTYYLSLSSTSHPSQWHLFYDFNSIYQPGCSQCLLITGMNKLSKNNRLVSSYKYCYTVGNPNSQPINTNPAGWPYYWCGIKHFTPTGYQRCVTSFTSQGAV